MFTSKKAQYLNKDFDRISPITNIDSLYYEQAEKDGDSSYIIQRRSVAKYMPIKFDISNFLISSIDVSNSSNPITGEVSLGPTFKNISTNINYIKSEILNPSDSITHELLYDTSLYTIDSSKNINIQDLLQYYATAHYFNTSINSIINQINIINSSIQNINNYVYNTSTLVDTLIYALHGHNEYYEYSQFIQMDTLNNGIYNLIYQPNNNASCLIKVQCISTNTIKNIISLDRAFNHSIDVSVEQWVFHYDASSNKITYLKDEYENEGIFDFRIAHKIYDKDLINKSFINNKLYFEPKNANIKFEGDGKFEGNEIYNSSNITFTGNASNNIVVNCYNVSISGSGNKIYNSSNTSTLVIKKSNNIIINCHDSSILVNGNSNYIMNSSNLNANLGDNNIIINDEIGCQPNTSTLENMKLFFNYSTSTALLLDHTSSCTFYGGIGNDVSVYVGSLKTTNKY